MPTFDDSVGGASSNSYISMVAADDYQKGNLNRETWGSATAARKEMALLMATRLLDEHYVWTGTLATSTQALGWPRTGVEDKEERAVSSTTIPTKIQEATAELAFWLLTSDRVLTSTESDVVDSVKVGPIEVEFSQREITGGTTNTVPTTHASISVMPPVIDQMLTGYIKVATVTTADGHTFGQARTSRS